MNGYNYDHIRIDMPALPQHCYTCWSAGTCCARCWQIGLADTIPLARERVREKVFAHNGQYYARSTTQVDRCFGKRPLSRRELTEICGVDWLIAFELPEPPPDLPTCRAPETEHEKLRWLTAVGRDAEAARLARDIDDRVAGAAAFEATKPQIVSEMLHALSRGLYPTFAVLSDAGCEPQWCGLYGPRGPVVRMPLVDGYRSRFSTTALPALYCEVVLNSWWGVTAARRILASRTPRRRTWRERLLDSPTIDSHSLSARGTKSTGCPMWQDVEMTRAELGSALSLQWSRLTWARLSFEPVREVVGS